MKPSENAYQIIKDWEKYSPRPIKAIPQEPYYTIGYGHYGSDVKKNMYVTPEQALQLMKEDVDTYSERLARSCPNLNQRQYDALISLIYNIGWMAFRYSMTYHKAKEVEGVKGSLECARRIVLWVRAGGRVLLGLQRRRVYEANYFLGYEHFKIEAGKIVEL